MKDEIFSIVIVVFLAIPAVAGDTPPAGPTAVAGFTQALYDVTIGVAEAGRIAQLKVAEGDRVKQGDVLLFLDKTLEELEVELRRIQANQRAELDYAVRKEQILSQQLASAKRLLADGAAISREQAETKTLEHAQAQSDVARLQTAKSLDQIELNLARAKLNRRLLVAPVEGVVVAILKRPGESVQAHEPLVRIVDATHGRFVGSTEEHIGRALRKGQDICLVIGGTDPPVAKKAKVTFVSPVIDTASGLMEVKAEFDNPEAVIRLGAAAELVDLKAEGCPCR